MALNYMHVHGIVYGDLKPENILIDNYGYIKMTDFGASRMLNGRRSIDAFAGTPDYLG
jgi:serine/threonine protein kinase